ncbi:uncharacterized protein LOC111343701 [Stylophora pistillata]|uniref:uncharacterized protein LOC111343701 n=1 Tax=Stylophora pistillata TaxID=50429 RepID=UPI000C041388|nr:uncharacterized protein LOC111343701 [Stylophora pistillata]
MEQRENLEQNCNISELYDVFFPPKHDEESEPNNFGEARYDEASEEPSADQGNFVIIMSCILAFAMVSAFVLLLLILFAVAQVFLSESLISTLVQTILTFVVTAWFGCLSVKGGVHEKVAKQNNRSGGGEEERTNRSGGGEESGISLLPKAS